MTRYGYLIAFLVVLAVPPLVRALKLAPQEAGQLPRPTAPPGDTLIVVTPHNGDIRREFAWAFSQWYREKYKADAALDYRTFGGTSDVKRLLETSYRAQRDSAGHLPPESRVTTDLDVVWGGGDFMFEQQLKPLGVLRPIPIDPADLKAAFPDPEIAGVRLYDYAAPGSGQTRPVYWVGVCLSSFGIVYNADVCDTLGIPLPKTWGDLADPRLAGLLALADPTHSGSAGVAYMTVVQRDMADAEASYLSAHPALSALPRTKWTGDAGYVAALDGGWKKGMGRLLLIAANARYFTDSATLVAGDVGNGQAAAGIVIDFYGRVEQEAVGARRASYVGPAAATSITPDPVGILYGVKGHKLELATRFVKFLISPQGQRLWDLSVGTPGGPRAAALRRLPARRDVYEDQTGWSDPVNPFKLAGGFNQRSEWNAVLTDTIPIWAAAWIDDGDALLDAGRRIAAVADPGRRGQLFDELANLPITRADVTASQKQRGVMESANGGGDAEEWKARQRIEWAQKFRAHYASVAADANATIAGGH